MNTKNMMNVPVHGRSTDLRAWLTFLVALKSAVAALAVAETSSQLEHAITEARAIVSSSPIWDAEISGFGEADVREMRELLSDIEGSIAFLERMPLRSAWETDRDILILGMETVIAVEAFTRPPMLHFDFGGRING